MIPDLVCPSTTESLQLIQSAELANTEYVPIERTGKDADPFGITKSLLVTADRSRVYPVVDGFPVLMAPEVNVKRDDLHNYDSVDLNDPRYAEAYEEMTVYNKICECMVKDASAGVKDTGIMGPMAALTPETDHDVTSFPRPETLWIDAKHDSIGQLEAYDYLAPLKDQVFLQLGGSGSHAVKALVAGAKNGYLLTPMIGEAKVAMYLAKQYGVESGLGCVIAVGEELPFAAESIDLVYSGGCFHHMRLNYTAKELHRILKKGGRFSGVDPWKTPLHTIGTNIIGKREKSVFCKPITAERLQPMIDQFTDFKVTRHGPFLRYMFLALEKLGIQLSVKSMLKIARLDDSIGKFTKLERYGGSIMLAGTK